MKNNKINKENIKELASKLNFKFSEKELIETEELFHELEENLKIFDVIEEKYDLKNIEEMIYTFEENTTYLREDDNEEDLDKVDVLKNAPESKYDQVVVKKVVK